jgi:hypothetical protein
MRNEANGDRLLRDAEYFQGKLGGIEGSGGVGVQLVNIVKEKKVVPKKVVEEKPAQTEVEKEPAEEKQSNGDVEASPSDEKGDEVKEKTESPPPVPDKE